MKLKHDGPLSIFAFNIDLRRYSPVGGGGGSKVARASRTREEGYQEVRVSAVTGEVSEGDSAGESPRSSGDGDAGDRQGLTLVPIPAQLELTLPLSAQLELTSSHTQPNLIR